MVAEKARLRKSRLGIVDFRDGIGSMGNICTVIVAGVTIGTIGSSLTFVSMWTVEDDGSIVPSYQGNAEQSRSSKPNFYCLEGQNVAKTRIGGIHLFHREALINTLGLGSSPE